LHVSKTAALAELLLARRKTLHAPIPATPARTYRCVATRHLTHARTAAALPASALRGTLSANSSPVWMDLPGHTFAGDCCRGHAWTPPCYTHLPLQRVRWTLRRIRACTSTLAWQFSDNRLCQPRTNSVAYTFTAPGVSLRNITCQHRACRVSGMTNRVSDASTVAAPPPTPDCMPSEQNMCIHVLCIRLAWCFAVCLPVPWFTSTHGPRCAWTNLPVPVSPPPHAHSPDGQWSDVDDCSAYACTERGHHTAFHHTGHVCRLGGNTRLLLCCASAEHCGALPLSHCRWTYQTLCRDSPDMTTRAWLRTPRTGLRHLTHLIPSALPACRHDDLIGHPFALPVG